MLFYNIGIFIIYREVIFLMDGKPIKVLCEKNEIELAVEVYMDRFSEINTELNGNIKFFIENKFFKPQERKGHIFGFNYTYYIINKDEDAERRNSNLSWINISTEVQYEAKRILSLPPEYGGQGSWSPRMIDLILEKEDYESVLYRVKEVLNFEKPHQDFIDAVGGINPERMQVYTKVNITHDSKGTYTDIETDLAFEYIKKRLYHKSDIIQLKTREGFNDKTLEELIRINVSNSLMQKVFNIPELHINLLYGIVDKLDSISKRTKSQLLIYQ